MDSDGLPLVGPGIDYTKVESIHQKRKIAFINHFITHTASFLNRFSGVCEQKLETLSTKMQQLEISMNLLEAKLSSVPGLENVTVATSATTVTTAADSTPVSTATTTTTAAPASSGSSAPPPPPVAGDPGAAAAVSAEESKPTMTVSQHPAYARFFRMVAVGVPEMAVKNKMAAEGLNADLLNTPDAPAPDGAGSSGGGGGNDNKSDSDDFSDDDENNTSDDNEASDGDDNDDFSN